MSKETRLITDILQARYTPHRTSAYHELIRHQPEATGYFLSQLLECLRNPLLETSSLEFPNFVIPDTVLQNNKLVRLWMIEKCKRIHESFMRQKLDHNDITAFLTVEHENLKWALNQWLLINPGQTREISYVTSDSPPHFLSWIKAEFHLNLGALVLNRHVISYSGQDRLEKMGFTVPYRGLHQRYYEDAMEMSAKILADNPECHGVISEGSWLYNPQNYDTAPDGLPFVRFTFLADERLVGKRFEIGNALAYNEHSTQYGFATRSPRRLKYVQSGHFKPKVYAAFYPREAVLANFTLPR